MHYFALLVLIFFLIHSQWFIFWNNMKAQIFCKNVCCWFVFYLMEATIRMLLRPCVVSLSSKNHPGGCSSSRENKNWMFQHVETWLNSALRESRNRLLLFSTMFTLNMCIKAAGLQWLEQPFIGYQHNTQWMNVKNSNNNRKAINISAPDYAK